MKLRNKKTGEIKDIRTILHEAFTVHGVEVLKNLEANWEDYKPTEPLVDGRSQRAVLRAAARLSRSNAVTVQRSDIAGIVIFDFGGQCRVELKDRGINVMNSGVYTITELCGEEKE